jgi:nitrile hydratase accessory protein
MTHAAPLHTLLPSDGPAAPPRQNGELIFATPWESRIFGVTVALFQHGHFAWREFQQALIDEIGAWERAHPDRAGWNYYERWQTALESLLVRKGLCAAADLDARAQTLAERPPGHDHQ